jgi:hypothetical protein
MSRAASRRRRRSLLSLIVLLALVGGAVYFAATFIDRSQTLVRERCTAVVGSDTFELAPDQAANAALISGVALQRGLPARAASIALATAIQESKLRNIDYGDTAGPDSRGLFQQRPSQGWGTEEQVQDPVYAANKFFEVLEQVPGYESMAVTDAAQTVQRSAYPLAYADHEAEGKAFASALTGHSPAALNCVLKESDVAGDPTAVLEQLEAAHPGLDAAVAGREVRVAAADERGWAVAQWAVASAKELNLEAVSYAGLSWQRGDGGWVAASTDTGYVVITAAQGTTA